MKVTISEAVIRAIVGTSDAWKLHRLLGYSCEGRHVVLFDPSTELDCWLQEIDSDSRTAYQESLRLGMRSAATLSADVATIRVDITDQSQWSDPLAVLNLDDALAVLNEPLGVLVENSANDWFFLQGMMRQSERERLQRAAEKLWVQSLHGGGSDLKNQLEGRLQLPARGLRTFVVFDSDRLHPDELDQNWSPEHSMRKRSTCQAFEWEKLTRDKLPLRYWMLKRRFIESYMPKSELSRAVSSPQKIDAFYRMNQEGRWYFNMKKGFDGDSKRHDNDRCRDLYHAINQNDRTALQNGFGENLADHYRHALSSEFDWDEHARQEASDILPRLLRLL